jgi:tripartite-type tricarboxylate transporter receptor subunit TctC
MKAPSVGDRLRLLSLAAVANTPAEAEIFVKDEAKRWQKVIDLIGLQPE